MSKTISKTLLNTELDYHFWSTRFTREELRSLAKAKGIKQGRDKTDVAMHLVHGVPSVGLKPVVFYVTLEVKA